MFVVSYAVVHYVEINFVASFDVEADVVVLVVFVALIVLITGYHFMY